MSQNDPQNLEDARQVEPGSEERESLVAPGAESRDQENAPREVGESGEPGASVRDVQGMETSGETHRMSIALTIGATIGAIGLILVLYGLWGKADYSRSDGININIWWGLVMLIFGIIMSVGGYLSAHRHVVSAS